MKKTVNIFVIALAFFALQSCDSKTNETTEEKDSESKIESVKELSQSEKKAHYEKQMADLKEERRIAYEKLVAEKPFYTHSEGYVVYNKAEVEPKYIGGKEAMESYLFKNLVYPSDMQDKGLEGTVYVDFLVANNGTVSNVTASNSSWGNVNPQFNEEAVRVVTNMPKWIPGLQEGKAVYVAYSVPITFRLL